MKSTFLPAVRPDREPCGDQVPAPSLAPGKVLIDVKAASLNFPDALMVQGACIRSNRHLLFQAPSMPVWSLLWAKASPTSRRATM